ncbi:MAG: hypothetical protein ACUVX8_17725 [Candidatus Zipacnadales bacterium]
MFVLVIAGCGCRREQPKFGSIQQLHVVRQRHWVDKQKRMCYIVAEIENSGKLPTPPAKVTATLKTKSGKERGLNHAFIESVAPGAKRILYMSATPYASFHRVEFSIHESRGKSK